MQEAVYTSEKEKKVLEVDMRREIYQIVKKYPGSHFRAIERRSKHATGSVQYHLDYLVKQGLLKVEKDGNNSRYYPLNFDTKNKKLMGLLRQRSLRSILLYVFSHSKCNHEDIVKFVRLSPSTVSFHLKKLEDSEVIAKKSKGRKSEYSLLVDKKEIVTLLIAYQESFFDSIVDNIVEMWD